MEQFAMEVGGRRVFITWDLGEAADDGKLRHLFGAWIISTSMSLRTSERSRYAIPLKTHPKGQAHENEL